MIITTHCWSLKKRGKETDKSLFHTDFELEVLNIVKFINIYILFFYYYYFIHDRDYLLLLLLKEKERIAKFLKAKF